MTVMTFNYISQALKRLAFFTRGAMKTQFSLLLAVFALMLWRCDEPVPLENDGIVYNPFSIEADSLAANSPAVYGRSDLNWGSHLRTIVGNTQYYKAGFTMDFTFSDSTLDVASADSIQLRLRHVATYPEDPTADTLEASTVNFGVYEVIDGTIDMSSDVYGSLLGYQAMVVQGVDNYWDINLPAELVGAGDTTLTLGFFPEEPGFMSFLYGGGSSLGPQLAFYYHELDTLGQDSATVPTSFLSDSVYVHLIEQPNKFNQPQTVYLSQLWSDSLVFQFDLSSIDVTGDTLLSISTASLIPNIDHAASSVYLLGSADSLFQMEIMDNHTAIARALDYGHDGTYYSDEINFMLQISLDEGETQLELVLRPDHLGFDPGFVAISMDPQAAWLQTVRTLAVRP